MALWGNDDSRAISGTASVTNGSATVTLTAGTSTLAAGQTIVLNAVEYRIIAVTGANTILLDRVYAGVTNGTLGTLSANEQPAYVPVADMPVVYGISTGEAQNATNRNKGIHSPGWVRHEQYTNAGSITRNRSETLVAGKFIAGDADGGTFPG